MGEEVRIEEKAEVDWERLGRVAIEAIANSHDVFVADATLSHAVGEEELEWPQGERPWSRAGQLVDAFITDFLRRALSEEGDLRSRLRDPTHAALDGATSDLAELLRHRRLYGALLAPLEGVRFREEVSLADGVEIVEFTPPLREEFWGLWGSGTWTATAIQPTELLKWTHAVRVSVEGDDFQAPNWTPAQEAAERALTAIRLCVDGPVVADFGWLRLDPPGALYGSRLGGGAGLTRRPQGGRRTFDFRLVGRDVAVELVTNFDRLPGAEGDPAFDLALRRFSSAFDRLSDEDRLIDHWVAFEALFAPEDNRELRFRASLRIARFIGRDPAERADLFRWLKRSYDWRSRIVHGGGQPSGKEAKQLGDLQSAVRFTEAALRRALGRWIDPEVSHQLSALDAEFLR